MNKLEIFYDKKLVGFLSYDAINDEFNFIYTAEWISKGFELSPYLKFNIPISSTAIKNFIENLLPEGTGREILSLKHHISKTSVFGLIQIIGKETTGALTFSQKNTSLSTAFRKITKQELAQRIKNRKNEPIEIWDNQARLSVAGVQDKLPISIIDKEYGFGEGNLASTHILKFEKNDENIILNEYLSLLLASKAGLNVAKADIINIEDQEVLLVKRFDRELVDNLRVKRTHIIDGCQALNLSVSHKYERAFGSNLKDYKEGVSFKKIFSLINLCDTPIIVKKNLITWVCVNLCLGNSDAHGKNLSFIIEKNSMTLAPFYDIVNITVYEDKYDTDFAMGIDEVFNYKELGIYDFIQFCKELNINLKGFIKEFNRVAIEINKSLDDENIVKLSNKNKVDFFRKYKSDVQVRIKKLMDVVDCCFEYMGSKN